MILLFPGILFHELSHYLMCLLLGVKVKKFQVRFKSGHVKHVLPKSITKSLLISVAPSIFAKMFAFIILFYRMNLITFYLAFVVLYASAPSKADTNFHKYHSFIKQIAFYPAFLLFRVVYFVGKDKYINTLYSLFIIFTIIVSKIIVELLRLP